MEKILTLAVTLFDLTDNEIENWKKIFELYQEESDERLQIIFLNDNPSKDNFYRDHFKNAEYYSNDKNIGKYQLIKSAVDSGLIKGKWIKVCDPDDIIIFKKVIKFLNVLNKFYESGRTPFIQFEYSRFIYPNDWHFEDFESILALSKLRKMKSLVNENSIIPTIDILNFDLIAYNQTKSSDVLFSLSSILNKDREVTYISIPFYIYNLHKGISSEKSSKKVFSVKKEKKYSEFFSFLKIMKKYNDRNTLNMPSFYDYKWIHNNLINDRVFFVKRIFYTNKAFNYLKKVSRDNLNWRKKWNLFEKLIYVYLFNFIRKGIK